MSTPKSEKTAAEPLVVWGLRKIGAIVGLSENVMLAIAEGRHPHAAWLRTSIRWTESSDGRRRWYAVVAELEAAARSNPRASEIRDS